MFLEQALVAMFLHLWESRIVVAFLFHGTREATPRVVLDIPVIFLAKVDVARRRSPTATAGTHSTKCAGYVARNAVVQANVELPSVRMTAAAIEPSTVVCNASYACHDVR